MIWLILFAILVIALVYVRTAPTDAALWHVPPDVVEDKTFTKGAIRVVKETSPDSWVRLHDIIAATPRTVRIAGDVNDRLVTYETRSKWFRFPDYTSVSRGDGQIVLYARLRFGRSDLGVNRARLERWIAQLGT